MNERMNKAMLAMSAAATLAIGAGALAQESGGGKVQGDFGTPMHTQPAKPGAKSTVIVTESDGGTTTEIKIVDGKVFAKMNGKEIPADRIRRHGDTIELLDENGKVARTIRTPTAEQALPGALQLRGFGEGKGLPGFEEGVFKFTMPQPGQPPAPPLPKGEPPPPPPKVMVGVNLSEPGEELCKKLGIEHGTGILIDKVIEGLPAEKAGVKTGDVVVSIDGQHPITPMTLREVLRKKEPGDGIEFVVLRGDAKEKLKVKLTEFNANKLGITYMEAPMPPDEGAALAWGEHAEEARKKAEQAMKEALRWREQMGREGGDLGLFLERQPNQMEWFTAPGNTRFKELNERLEKLDARLSELDTRLEKLAAAIEKMTGGRP